MRNANQTDDKRTDYYRGTQENREINRWWQRDRVTNVKRTDDKWTDDKTVTNATKCSPDNIYIKNQNRHTLTRW